MAGRGAGKASTIRVAVCGLTSSSYPGLSGLGAGKSCLCNRFVRPKKDDLKLNHTSVLNHSEFGTNVINNTHFLYWGEKVVGLEDGQDVTFQIIEHTEFVDDSSLKPFTFTKPYHKRCTQLKLQSGGKITYIEPDQLALPEQYTDIGKFPDKFIVEGFIICIDVSTDFEEPNNPQREFLDRLLPNIISTKKPVVVACTKFDRALDYSVSTVLEIVAKTKRPIPVIEVSALRGVNVDLCFLVLAHLVDSRKPKSKIIPYMDARQHLDDRIRKNEMSFQYVLDNKLSDFSVSVEAASTTLSNDVEFQLLRELCGTERIHKLIRAKLNYLKKQAVEQKLSQSLQQLPALLDTLLPTLPLEANMESCLQLLRESVKSTEFLVDLNDWREDDGYLKTSNVVVPISLFSEPPGDEILQRHIDKVLAPLREEIAYERIQNALEGTAGLVPGTDISDVLAVLGVGAEAELVSPEHLMKLYQDHMAVVEQECVNGLKELLLEHSDLFAQSDSANILEKVDQGLTSYDRYQRLGRRTDLRKSTVIKHIANVQWPDKGPYARSHLLETLQSETPDKDSLLPPTNKPSPEDLQWVLDVSDQCFNLAILARTEENALTLRSDFMNHLSGHGTFMVNDRRYELEMKLFHGRVQTLTDIDFIPQGAVAVVTSIECLDWLEDLLNELFIPGGDIQPRFRGMPLVILAVDGHPNEDDPGSTNNTVNADSELWRRAKNLANRVQVVCITEHLAVVPKRLVVTSVIHTLLVSLMDAVAHCDRFLSSDLSLEPDGLNIAVFSLLGDPYSDVHLLTPWLQHQLVWYSKKHSCLFVRAAMDKQHRTCSLTFHSALNTMNLKDSIRLGFVLIYSAERPASLAVIKTLFTKLPKVPVLLVAMVTEGSHDSPLLEVGRGLAEQWKASFVSSSEQSWSVGYTSEFFSKCWFSRFSSWNAQEVPDEVKQRLRRRRPMALPDRPFPSHPSFQLDAPHSLSSSSLQVRHSIAADTDFKDPFPTHPFLHSVGSLPRSPLRSNYSPQRIKSSSEDPMYSTPQELGIGVLQKKATLEREKKDRSRLRSSPSFQMPSEDQDENSEYALVADHIKMLPGGRGSLKRPPVPPKSPSLTPPPLPPSATPSPPLINGQLIKEEDDGDSQTYDTVQQPTRSKLLSPTNRGYDHLDQVVKTGYDHLVPQAYPSDEIAVHLTDTYATIEDKRRRPLVPGARRDNVSHPADPYAAVQRRRSSGENPHQESVDDHMYSVVNKPRRQRSSDDVLRQTQPVVQEMYATVEKPRKKPLQRYTPENAPDDLYSLPERRKRSDNPPSLPERPKRSDNPPEDFYSLPDRRRRAADKPPEDFYSLPDRRRKAVKVKPAPPVAPKPKVDKMRRSPTPKATLASQTSHSRSESPDLSVSPKPSRIRQFLSSPKARRKREQAQQLKSQSEKTAQNPMMANLAVEAADRASSLPRDAVMQRDRAWSDGGRSRVRVDVRDNGEPSWMVSSEGNRGRGGRTSNEDDWGHVTLLSSGDELDEEEEGFDIPTLPERRYSATELGLEDEPPPLPPRNYSWSDVEDNDDELFQSDDDLDESPAEISASDQLAIYASMQQLKRSSSIGGIEAIYNVVNRVAQEQESQQQQHGVQQREFSVYDTLQSVIRSMPPEPPVPMPIPGEEGGDEECHKTDTEEEHAAKESPSAATPPVPIVGSTPFTSREVKMIKQQQKLLEKLQKKAEKEAERRRKQEAKRRRRDEEELRKKEGRKKIKRPKGHKEPERQRYFGSPLEVVAGDDGVPVFVKMCTEIIEDKALKAEGIYRVSGKKEDCLTLQERFDEDSNLDVASLGYCETVISSTLKAFFKLLPDPLISNEIAAKILIVNSLPADTQQAKMHEILCTMPPPNLKTLRYLLTHLHCVQEHQDVNKMSASNLAIVFWPTLMRPPLLDLADPSKQLGWQLAMTRIIEHPHFVPQVDLV